jgi:hypothetical protein
MWIAGDLRTGSVMCWVNMVLHVQVLLSGAVHGSQKTYRGHATKCNAPPIPHTLVDRDIDYLHDCHAGCFPCDMTAMQAVFPARICMAYALFACAPCHVRPRATPAFPNPIATSHLQYFIPQRCAWRHLFVYPDGCTGAFAEALDHRPLFTHQGPHLRRGDQHPERQINLLFLAVFLLFHLQDAVQPQHSCLGCTGIVGDPAQFTTVGCLAALHDPAFPCTCNPVVMPGRLLRSCSAREAFRICRLLARLLQLLQQVKQEV